MASQARRCALSMGSGAVGAKGPLSVREVKRGETVDSDCQTLITVGT